MTIEDNLYAVGWSNGEEKFFSLSPSQSIYSDIIMVPFQAVESAGLLSPSQRHLTGTVFRV